MIACLGLFFQLLSAYGIYNLLYFRYLTMQADSDRCFSTFIFSVLASIISALYHYYQKMIINWHIP